MKLKTFLENFSQLLEKFPEAENYEVIFARDDEGNGYQEVYFDPSLGHFNGDWGGEFTAETSYDKPPNSVCVN